jgi:hypothetical protein
MSLDERKPAPKPTGVRNTGTPDAKDASPAAGSRSEAKPKPLFRIVPADPKNSLNFEDTADK